ncbi:MAG: MMPL family transporter [Deltaproteobacteria bacterium]|nr:MMPL family transporter [Deltaproteobacteria bacterium]
MERLAKILYRFRFFWLGPIIAVTVVFGSLIKIEMDNSLKAWFSVSDPDYIVYEDYRDTFEGGRVLMVVLRSEDIFSLEVLNYIKQKTEEFEDLAQVKRVHSLANANKVIGTSEGIEINPLLLELETNNLQKIRKYALEDELFRDYLVSSNEKFTAIVITFEDMPAEETDKAVCQVEEIAHKGRPRNLEVSLSGDMRAMSEFNRFTKQNQSIFPLLTIAVICIFIFVLFRSLYKNLIILLVIGMSLCWALGFYSALGYTFNVVTGMLIPLVMILSIANCIHIMKYFDEVREDSKKREAFIRTIKYITIPCFITSITTAFGLLSLSISHIDAVKHFGIGSAAGIMFAFFISITLVPLLLSLLPSNQEIKRGRGLKHLLNGISKFNERRFKYTLVVAVLGFIFFGWGITKVKIETNQIEWFPKKGDFYKSSMLVDKNLSGIGVMEIVIKGEEDVLKEPEILKRVDKLSSEIEKLPRVKKLISLVDYVKRINKALEADNPEYYRIPDSKSLIAQELLLFTLSDDGRKELENIVTPDYAQGRISIKTESMPSRKSLILGNLLEKMAKETFSGTGISITLTGTIYLYNLLQEYLLESQIRGFSLAFLSVIGVLFIAFWSARYGGLSIIPNLLPIIFIMGIMGWSGIALNTGTVMIASVALGIAADDTIHFISRFRKELKSNKFPVQDALKETTVSVGDAIIFTSVINMAGFLILLISGFQPTREFGMLIALTLFFALIGDILVLPSSIVATRRFLIRKFKP